MDQALTIATSDSGGGAGVQADLKSFAANNVYGTSIIVALTAQNTREVKSIYPLSKQFIQDQFDVIFSDFTINAVKIGMLYSASIIGVVVENLLKYKAKNIVVDPVMLSKSGAKLLEDSAVYTLREELFKIADLITPNIEEATYLSGVKIQSIDDMKKASKIIKNMGPRGVLIKGGHLEGEEAIDLLFYNNDFSFFKSQKISTKNTHGTGCTYSSAIAANLAKGKDIVNAVESAKTYTFNAIKYAKDLYIGNGFGPLNHFYFLEHK
ncbi:MAG: bifunctional hydroxymethylpyrimidine kinase/phosphomethylpyrimidine kinase [Deferribacterota bacterium]|nr:bifunctional hydroxymethylpyrimidine kinase/phosphomethylpyrimidine kinase [Deferribacterota bacterium]